MWWLCEQCKTATAAITEAEVHLNPQEAIITMNNSISVEELQRQLDKAGPYSIKEVVLNLEV